MFDFERPNIEVAEISEDKKYGKFVVEPLGKRIWHSTWQFAQEDYAFLSAGAAVSQIKLKASLHEFKFNPGVRKM